MSNPLSRRAFTSTLATVAAAILVARREAFAGSAPSHPDPRPGITGRDVLTKEQLGRKVTVGEEAGRNVFRPV